MDTIIYALKSFAKWAKAEKVTSSQLRQAIDELNNGLSDANLGNGLYKKRVARKGAGKRGGFRCLLAFKKGNRKLFCYRGRPIRISPRCLLLSVIYFWSLPCELT